MVTVDLDFGPTPPGVTDALREIERRHQPDDGRGRTFAIIEAFGQPQPSGPLRLSMRISAEKPGLGSLGFRRTGEVLWRSRIVPPAQPPASTFSGRNLTILLSEANGKFWTVDGSSNPQSILEARVKELGVAVADAWPDSTERELAFIYSACGCPVKVTALRVGDRTHRTQDQPVLFPDDPAVVALITKLMRW